jgi:hypothetical protein
MKMKVYLPNRKSGVFRMHIQPGAEYKDVSEWKDEIGHPIYMTIPFIDGEAKVKDNIGRYLIDKGLAQKSPLILPENAQHASA